jgi:ABC-2 type transport system permease protein
VGLEVEPMWAIFLKELRQIRRDHRSLALMIVLPLTLLIVFGYAASFDVTSVPTAVVGPFAEVVSEQLPPVAEVVTVDPSLGRDDAVEMLRDGEAVLAVVADPQPAVLVDGSHLFAARAAVTALNQAAQEVTLPAGIPFPQPEVLFNPELDTSTVMVPGLIGIILVAVGTVMTSLGVVRERQTGTLEQLAVMPFSARGVFLGKVLPYFGIAAFDVVVVVTAGMLLFDMPFEGSVAAFALAAVLFLFVTLGIGVLISTVSENQGQAIQLAMMTLLPQILLSGLLFPLESMGGGVRWIAYLLPLSYFIEISRALLVRGASFASLLFPYLMLAVLGAVVFTASVLRFRRDLAPRSVRVEEPVREPAGAR